MSEPNPTQTIESKTAVDYLNPENAPEPSEETGLGTHFANTFDPALKKNAPHLPDTKIAPAPQQSAKEKLAKTSSTMTTAQLQKAAQEGDPNALGRNS
ncbi:hypothetical protein Slin15195_G068490 [Septoria linicola]|uniref:Uncharacterized protein n=1 Tax=Septoria linicola TaxID=215465 RepID=A0A9Q9AVX0_9PEZI|nr:hypothetical protein Slin15195_G068490 [Septoria linicola]